LPGFDLETYQIPLDTLMPSKRIPDGVMSTRKYKQVVSSIHEIGLIAKDNKTYTYSHRVNRLSTIQEHYMIRRAIDRGVSKECLA